MAQQLPIADTCTALAALLAEKLQPYGDGDRVDVKEAGKADFDDDGQLILGKIAVRVRYGQSEYAETRDVTNTATSADHEFQIICHHESLRGGEETRSRTLDLLDAVLQELAGTRLLLPNGARTEPILLRNVVPVSDGWGPVDDCFGLTIRVSGYCVFDGRNANPVAGGAQ